MTTLLATGDLILDEPDPSSYFQPTRALLRKGDVVVGQVETPYTFTATPSVGGVPAPATSPEQLDALAEAGFTVATLAGNHIFDHGGNGIRDTIERLRAGGIVTVGAGMNLDEARRAAVVEAAGRRVGVLSFNTVGPRESWAGAGKPGCAYVRVLTHYELDHASPGGKPTVYTFCDPGSLEAMEQDVAALRRRCDAVLVALHKGVNGSVVGQWYEKQVSHAAIDAGADVVVGHHPHIMSAIEAYRGRPIFHGLGNFVTVTRALSMDPRQNFDADRLEHARRRKELFGFEPDPDMATYPFHPDSRNTVIARVEIGDNGSLRASCLPCYIDGAGRPQPAAREGLGAKVLEFLRDVNRRSGLETALEWAEDGSIAVDLAGSLE